MIRSLSVCGLAAALLLTAGLPAFAGLFHRHRHDAAGCTEPGLAAFEPGCSAFEPACGLEPACGFEPACGLEPSCGEPAPCIKYHHKHAFKHRRAAGCCETPTYETVLMPTSPETCRTVAVPVCLPACCQGCPCETSRSTLLGCGQVRYDYACGCSVIVRFQKCGDILVTYVGF